MSMIKEMLLQPSADGVFAGRLSGSDIEGRGSEFELVVWVNSKQVSEFDVHILQRKCA